MTKRCQYEHEKPETRHALIDARGIFCCYVCDACEADRRKGFRAEIFDNASYEADEPIEDC